MLLLALEISKGIHLMGEEFEEKWHEEILKEIRAKHRNAPSVRLN